MLHRQWVKAMGESKDGADGAPGAVVHRFESAAGGACRGFFFSRRHGHGHGQYASLNLSLGVGDGPETVLANRRSVKQWTGTERILCARQVHGDRIHTQSGELTRDLEVDGCDALITDRPGIGLLIQHADCQAVLLHDPQRRAIAAVHCGWRGSVVNILAQTVDAMVEAFSCRPADLQAAISPSLGACCAEFVNHRRELPADFRAFMVGANHFDFWRISRWQLTEAGLAPERVHLPEVCTSCSRDYFSYRRARREGDGTTGRNGSLIVLESEEHQ